MRLHRLEASAFGPFASRVEVDFDDLSSAGLFLLSGPTGAGKSSVLDAICFALYGEVPGDRASAKRLRCDQAAAGVAPRVVLEATLSGRRIRLDRSPSWIRPKRRGEGTTTEPARVAISERVDGEWVPLSTRLDETGHLVTRLVGMNLPQFTQVAMLPQGRFQAFLRARSEDRHALLQQVFDTGRFDQVERWLRDHRVELRRRSHEHEASVADLASRFSEAADSPPPEEASGLVRWAHSARGELDAHVQDSRTAREQAERADAEARVNLVEATGRLALRQRHDTSRAELDALLAAASEHDDDVRDLAAAREAAPVRPLHTVALAATASTESAARARGESLRAVALLTDETSEPGVGDLETRRREAVEVLSRTRRVRPLVATLDGLSGRETLVAARLENVTARTQELEERLHLLPDELEESRILLEAARTAALAVETTRTLVDDLVHRCRAAEQAVELTAELAHAQAERLDAVGDLQRAKGHWLDLRELRLDGMAAEIAADLAVGDSCPVCGSCEHPSPAGARPGAPDAAAEQTARRDVDDLESHLVAHDGRVRDLSTSLAAATATAGAEPESLAQRRHDAEAELRRRRAEAAPHESVRARIGVLESERDRVESSLVEVRAEQSDLALTAAQVAAEQQQVRDQLTELTEHTGFGDLEAVEAHYRALDEACGAALEAHHDWRRAREVEREAWERVGVAADEAGFASLEACLAAGLPRERLDSLERRIQEHRRAVQRAEEVLADPAVQQAMAEPAPDVESATRHADLAEAELTRIRARHETLVERLARATALATELETADGAWAPVRDQLALATSLSAFVEGKSADNRLQMRLSAYVLVHRLTQVVEAANLRLSAMSDQRYALEHTGRRGAGETRGGLSLLVRDEWSGESRDPVTLSGGETFVVSLALALGLADVITQEAGGADLDTLFVDEGFGSLDAQTLDDVMDTLDSLRDGGRVVGVVSHVAEMQTRIPAQLRVHKERSGSRLSQVSGTH